MSQRPANEIAAAFLAACRDELYAPKPGNVHVFAGGHGMTAEHFQRSAAAAAAPLCQPGAPVGSRILGAVEATFASVGLNTNLGIILLCAPLAAAAESRRESAGAEGLRGRQKGQCAGAGLRAALAATLAGLTRDDAQSAFEAIVIAAPAGLGAASRHDVRMQAETTLLEAMKEASDRDRIAQNYATGYADVFDTGIGALDAARKRGWPAPWPVVGVYLDFLAGIPDSHIARKHGFEAALEAQSAAVAVRARFMTAADPKDAQGDLLDFDCRLKASGLNPGTSADLTVATLFADRLTRSLIQLHNND